MTQGARRASSNPLPASPRPSILGPAPIAADLPPRIPGQEGISPESLPGLPASLVLGQVGVTAPQGGQLSSTAASFSTLPTPLPGSASPTARQPRPADPGAPVPRREEGVVSKSHLHPLQPGKPRGAAPGRRWAGAGALEGGGARGQRPGGAGRQGGRRQARPGGRGQAMVLSRALAAGPARWSPASVYPFGVFLQEGEPESVQLGDLLEKEARAPHFSNRSQRGGLSGTVLPRTRGLHQAPPELPQRPVCVPGWRRGTVTPACQTAQLLRERGPRQEVTLSLPLSGSPSPGPPQPRGSGAHRTLSKRGFPSPSPSACRGGGELGLACIQGPWGPLHSPKHFSHC